MTEQSEYFEQVPASNEMSSGVAASAFPLLDPQETSIPAMPATSYRKFMTSGMMPDILFNREIYAFLDDRDGKNRAATFDGCRTSAWFVRHRVSGEIRVASGRCRQRWCPLCIQTKRYIMTNSIIPWVKNVKKPKFVTLTLKHSTAPLSHQIESIYDYFKILRRRPRWKKKIKGGIWFFQVTKSKRDDCWHPHLHILCEGDYISRDDLSDMWLSVTGSSSIVDIKKVNNAKDMARYVSRYATAPCRLSDLSFDDAVECVDALHGKRICGKFGTGSSIELNPSSCECPDDWENMGSFGMVLAGRHVNEYYGLVYQAWIKDEQCVVLPNPPPRPEFVPEEHIKEDPSTYKQFTFEFNGQLNQSIPKGV